MLAGAGARAPFNLADVFRNPQLRRLELSWAGFYPASGRTSSPCPSTPSRWAARPVGALGLVRMVPAAIALPFGGMLADRYPRQRVLLGIYGARAAAGRHGSRLGG